MKAPRFHLSSSRRGNALAIVLFVVVAANADATTQLLLARDGASDSTLYRGVVELTVDPGFENAHVTILVDGQKLAEGLRTPYKVMIDFGPNAIQHRIAVTAFGDGKQRVQWHTTINRGNQPLRVKLRAIDLASGTFEAATTSPADDPVVGIEVWDEGKQVAAANTQPFRFTVPAAAVKGGFLQVTAKTKSGEEAADFWSPAGEVHVETVEVRTVPIFVSVIDSRGATRVDVDKSLFRILDNGTEGKILEFGRAFDQPISIALLIDASASMTYAIADAAKAAQVFVRQTLKQGDRCAVFAVRDVPRRIQELTADRTQISKALSAIQATGQTAIYDAIWGAIRELKDEKNRRAIVVLTDGGDTSSNLSFDEIDKSATEAGIPIYFIAYENGDPTAPQEYDRLNYLAGQTGGFVARASQNDLQSKYDDIEKDLRAQYAIRYQISDIGRRNEWRRVRVVLGSPKLTARTIRGYFAP